MTTGGRGAGFGLFVGVLVITATFAVLTIRFDQARRALRALERETVPRARSVSQERWLRPVLRGRGVEGNAWPAIVATSTRAAAHFPRTASEAVTQALETGQAVPIEWTAVLDAARTDLARLRETTQFTGSWNPAVIQTELSPPPAMATTVVRAQRGMLVAAVSSSSADCLALCADVVRISQDFSAGLGLIGMAIEGTNARLAASVALRCAQNADRETRARAGVEFTALHRAWRPIGAFKIVSAFAMVRVARLEFALSHNGFSSSALEFYWHQPDAVARLAKMVSHLPRWQNAGALGEDPTVLDRLAADDFENLMGNPLTEPAAVRLDRLIENSRRGRAWVSVVATVLGDAEHPLEDPFAMAPVRVTRTERHTVVRSVGPDRRADTHDDITASIE